jgi:hypothetical protein
LRPKKRQKGKKSSSARFERKKKKKMAAAKKRGAAAAATRRSPAAVAAAAATGGSSENHRRSKLEKNPCVVLFCFLFFLFLSFCVVPTSAVKIGKRLLRATKSRFSLSLTLFIRALTPSLSLSLTLSFCSVVERIPVYFMPRLDDDDDDDDDDDEDFDDQKEKEEANKKKGKRRRIDQAIVSYPLRPPNRPYLTMKCKSILHKPIAGWFEMKVPTKEENVVDLAAQRGRGGGRKKEEEEEEEEETVVLRSEQRTSMEKHESQKSVLVAMMNEKGDLFLTPANVSHQMRPSFTHIVGASGGAHTAFQKQHQHKVKQEEENHEEATETVQEEERRIAREEQEALENERRRAMTAASTATKIVPVSVSIKANETERQQERRKNSYQFQNSEREKEMWSELEPSYKSSEYMKAVVEDLFSKKTSDWCGDRMVGAREYLDTMCPMRGKARRDLPDSDGDGDGDNDDINARTNKNRSRENPAHIEIKIDDDAEDEDAENNDDGMDIDEKDDNNNDENEEERLNNDNSGDFDDVFVDGFQIRDVLKFKTVDERLDELFARSGTSFMKFSGIKKLAPRNTKQRELLSAVAAKASLVNGVWVVNSALRSLGDRNYERVRDSVLCSFSRGKKISVNDGHNATKEEERLRQKALSELGAAVRGPANQGTLFEFYPSRDDLFSRKHDNVVMQQKNRWEHILGFFERGKDFSPFEYLLKGPEVPDVDENARKTTRRACETILKPCFGSSTASSKKLESLPTVSDIRDVLKRCNSRYHALREPELLRLISPEPLIVIGGHVIGFHRVMNTNSTTTNEEARTKRAIIRELMLSTSGNIKKESVLKACEKIINVDAAKVLQEMCTSSGGVWSIDLAK